MTTYKLFYGEPDSDCPTHVCSESYKTDPYLGLLTNQNMVNDEPWWVILA